MFDWLGKLRSDTDQIRIDRVVCGLGNPGLKYDETRHNLGFRALDEFLGAEGIRRNFIKKSGCRRQVVEIAGRNVMLIKPVMFMNLSGDPVFRILNGYGLKPVDLLVVHDEMDIQEGHARMKVGGGSGGHRGVASIMEKVGTPDFTRIKIGIGRPKQDEPGADPDWVLGRITPEEEAIFSGIMPVVAQGIKKWLAEGVDKAMSWFNREIREINEMNGRDSTGSDPVDV